MTTLDYEHVRARHEERIARSLAAYAGHRPRGRGCALEQLVRWIGSRRRNLDPAPLAR